MKEEQVLKEVINKLKNLMISGDVLWFRRLHNGLFYTRNGTPVRMGAKQLEHGMDLDLVVIVNCRNGKIAQLHIDVKRSGVNKFDYEQEIFAQYMSGFPMTMCAIVNDAKQLWPLVKRAKEL